MLRRGFLLLAQNYQGRSGAELDLIFLERNHHNQTVQNKNKLDTSNTAKDSSEINQSRPDDAVNFPPRSVDKTINTSPSTDRSDSIEVFPQDTLVFVEVKTRSSQYFGGPEYAVSRDKINQLKKAAADFRHEFWGACGALDFRFDIISLIISPHQDFAPQINYFQNITWLNHR